MKSRVKLAAALVGAGVLGLVLGLWLSHSRPTTAHAGARPFGYVIDVGTADPAAWQTSVNAARLVHSAFPAARLEIVAHGPGIRMLLASSTVADQLESLIGTEPVELAACANAMQSYGIQASDLVPQATVVPAGVVEVARREAEGYLYMNAA